MKLFLDTSVISAYFDERQPERMTLTREFWKNLKGCQVFISEITVQEINLVAKEKLREEKNFLN